jgi:hypothetical protein
MQAYDGERRFPRLATNKAGVLENLDSGGQDRVTLINFSGDGMCIELDRPYPQGTRVRLSVESWQTEEDHRTFGGEVRWCNAVKRKEIRRYEIGVKIQSSEPL